MSLSCIRLLNKQASEHFTQVLGIKIDKRINLIPALDFAVSKAEVHRDRQFRLLLMTENVSETVTISWQWMGEESDLADESLDGSRISFSMTLPPKERILKYLLFNPSTNQPYPQPGLPKQLPFRLEWVGAYGEGTFTFRCKAGTDLQQAAEQLSVALFAYDKRKPKPGEPEPMLEWNWELKPQDSELLLEYGMGNAGDDIYRYLLKRWARLDFIEALEMA